MDLKTGYKQTEIGVIPMDWAVKKLNNLSEKIMVGIASAATHAYRNSGVVLFRNQNIKSNYLDDRDILYVSEEYEQIFKGKRLKEGDLLTARTGYPGTTCIIPKIYEDSQSFTTLITRIKPKKIQIKFLCFYMNSEKGQAFFESNQIGGGQKNVNAGTLKLMPIPIPSEKEQTAIATALSDADGLITGLEKLIAKKRNIKQGAMQQLLQPKEGWEVKKIIELSENKKELFDDGDWVESEHIINEGVRLIQTGNIGVGKYLEKGSKKYISENSFIELKCKPLIKGDILICRLADPAGRACIFPDINEQKVITSVDVTIFRPKIELVNRNFLLYTFSTSKWFQQIIEKVGGTTHKRISRSSLGNIRISLPALEEQIRIAKILFDMDAELSVLEQKLEKYKKVKLGMMQELLTGKTRLV